jgi:hypothetical protein
MAMLLVAMLCYAYFYTLLVRALTLYSGDSIEASYIRLMKYTTTTTSVLHNSHFRALL